MKRAKWKDKLDKWLNERYREFYIYGMTYHRAAQRAFVELELGLNVEYVARVIKDLARSNKYHWKGGSDRWASIPLLPEGLLTSEEWDRLQLKCSHFREVEPMTIEEATRKLMISTEFKWPVAQVREMLLIMKIPFLQTL